MISDSARPGTLEERIDTSHRANLAWKTGTSYGFRDAWALGATPGATIGVWIGRPDGTPLPGQYGAITALPLLYAINDALPRALQAAASPAPPSVGTATICWPLGQREDATPPEHCVRRHTAWVLDSTVPATLPGPTHPAPTPTAYRRDRHSGLRLSDTCRLPHAEERASIAPWPALVMPWLASGERRQSILPALAADCSDTAAPLQALQIVGLVDGAVLRSPSNRQRAPEVNLRALGTGDAVQWLLDGRLVAHSQGAGVVQLRFDQTGPQRLLAIDTHGRYASIDLRVLD